MTAPVAANADGGAEYTIDYSLGVEGYKQYLDGHTEGFYASSPATLPSSSQWNCVFQYRVPKTYNWYVCTEKKPTTPTTYHMYLNYNENAGSDRVVPFPRDEEYTSTTNATHMFTVSSIWPTRSGYEFVGWNTDRNATTASKRGGDTILIARDDPVTLYAIWKKSDKPADTTPPVIKGADDKNITVGDSFDPKTGVTATDKEDGDLTSKIKITGTVDNKKPGKYELTYTVSDKAGNKATKKRTITVIDKTLTATAMPQTGSTQTMTLTMAGTALLLAGASVALKRRQSSTR